MSCKFIDQTCINCKHTDEYMVYSNVEPKNDFDAYKNYIDYDLQVCQNCGYISTDLEKIGNLAYRNIKNTPDFKDALNYSYLDEYLENMDTEKLYSYPANLYEAYGILQEKSLNTDDSIRAYFRSVVLKEAIVRRYQKEREDDADELEPDEIQEFYDLENALTQSIKNNLIKIIELYQNSTQDKFISIIYIECLLRFFKVQEAQDIYNKIQNKIDKELKEYIEDLIEQRR